MAALLAISAAIVLAGQATTELVTMDDFREVEVAREMLRGGDYVVPHLAGRPFVEKPPGFPILLTLAFRLAGGPSVPAARLLTAATALLSLAAVYRLAGRSGSRAAGAGAVLALASSACFSRVAHTILLDNALVAATAWAHVWFVEALEEPDSKLKRRRFAVASFLIGVAFLFKGFVGPAIFGAGALAYFLRSRRWSDLRAAMHPFALGAFLSPVLCWVAPFVLVSPPSQLYEFFISNHVGRAWSDYEGHARPFYFYGWTLGWKFAPAAMLLPFAIVSALKRRRSGEGERDLYFVWSSLGGLLLLSLCVSKDAPYLLPIYPLLAALVGRFAARSAERFPATPAWAAAALAGACALAFYLPPTWDLYQERKSSRPMMKQIVAAAGDADLLLYCPEDRARGALGFYRDRTAEEVNDPGELMERLRRNPGARVVVDDVPEIVDGALIPAARRAGLVLELRLRVRLHDGRPLALLGVGAP
jgi:4-amino-4-deoxy-L-arabinose transferase-like glycosyltransferase